MSDQHTYAGHTLAEIKAAAESMPGWNYDEARRVGEDEICEFGTELDGEWYPIGTVDGQTYTGEPADDLVIARHIVTANPDTVLAMAARIEELETDLQLAYETQHDLLHLIAEIRLACGDDGKRMLPELVQYVAGMAMDAERYRWLRGQLWSDSALAVVSNPKCNVRLGTYCPSGSLLDSAIDAVMEQTKNREGA